MVPEECQLGAHTVLCPPHPPNHTLCGGQPSEVFLVGSRPSQGQPYSSSHLNCVGPDMATALIQIPIHLLHYQ